MTGGTECAQVTETVTEAARKMTDLDVGALPICGDDNRLKGVITDRDIVLKSVAAGIDTSEVKVEEYAGDVRSSPSVRMTPSRKRWPR